MLGPRLAKAVEKDANFLFAGPVGVGKTFAMAAAARLWAPKVRPEHDVYRSHGPEFLPFVWTSESALWAAVRSTWSGDGRESDIMRQVAETPLLCLDDLGQGASAAPKAYPAFLFGLVNARYTGNKKTFVTTNAELADIRRISPAAVDRLLEMCVCVEMTGRSRRKPAGSITIGGE